MSPSIVTEAVAVLNVVQHRRAKNWCFDPQTRRIMPEAWSNLYEVSAPCFTVFEALAVARRLVEIGAVQSERPR